MNFEQLQSYAVLATVSYLLGSVPTALVVTAIFKRVDLRSTGSGNLGIYNTLFRVGKLPAICALIWNFSAAASAVLLAKSFFSDDSVAVLIAITAVTVGSMWQVFARFSGSRGTTTLGFALVYAEPLIWAACVGAWLLALLPRRRTTDATPTLTRLFPVIFGLMTWSWTYVVAGAVIGLLLEIKRRSSADDTLALGLFRRFGINPHS